MNNLGKKFDIVDAQAHIGPDSIDEILSAMNALGIKGLVIDECWLENFEQMNPNQPLENQAYRPLCPTAQLASITHPDRFAWVLRVSIADPDYEAIIRFVKNDPHGKAIRLDVGLSPILIGAFEAGAYDGVLASAEAAGVPVFLFLQERPELIARTAEKFPHLKIIIDHCGLYSYTMRRDCGGIDEDHTTDQQVEIFKQICELAKYDNVALKWAHAAAMFNTTAFPCETLAPMLRMAIDAFGANRVMWASDFSVNQTGDNWGQLLYSMLANNDLSEDELALIMGGTLRNWIGWPAA